MRGLGDGMKVHKITCEKHDKIAVYCEDCLAEKMKECEEDLKEIIKLNQKIIHERDKEIWKLKKEREKETFNEKQSKTVAKLLDEQEKLVRDKWKDAYEGERFAREECEKEINKLKEQLEIHKKSKPEMFKQQERNRIRKEIEKFENPYPKDIFRWNNKEKMEITRGRFNQFAHETVENVREKVLKILEGEE